MGNPKVFISYSWSSPEHERWVIDLASQLRESGADAILDKWDLKEGHDAVAFMEKMVTDQDIKKVIVILDKVYAEKADGRSGGVGTETQIISAEVYRKTDQDKFVAVVCELDEDGKPFLPTYYKSRIYIDLSDNDSYAKNFDQLLRWIYDKPLHLKPELGNIPAFLNENAIMLGTQTRARRAIEAIRSHSQNAQSIFEDYLTTLANELERFRLSKADDEMIYRSISEFLPYRNEYIEVLSALSRHTSSFNLAHSLHRFLEKALAYCYKPLNITSWHTWDFDNYLFIVPELFLYTTALLLRNEHFISLNALLSESYYLGELAENRLDPMETFGAFRTHISSFTERNRRLNLSRLSLRADLLKQRSETSGISFNNLMQADFTLFLRDSAEALQTGRGQIWWPETLIYAGRRHQPFEIFARSQSAAYFNQIKVVLGVSSVDELKILLKSMSTHGQTKLYIPTWQFDTFDPANLAGIDNLGGRP